MDKIPTSHGDLTPSEIIDHLTYASYKANRGDGMTHDQLVRLGIGTEAMKLKYEQEEAPQLHPIFEKILKGILK